MQMKNREEGSPSDDDVTAWDVVNTWDEKNLADKKVEEYEVYQQTIQGLFEKLVKSGSDNKYDDLLKE